MTNHNTLSLESISKLRSEAHATIKHHAAEIISISSAIGEVDAALQLTIAERSIDEQQGLITAAQHLAGLLDCEAGQ